MEYAAAALVVMAVLAFVVLPLVRGVNQVPTGETLPSSLTAAQERASIYQELVELELDHRVGKVTADDYREQADLLLARAAALISEEDAQLSAADEHIEREIAAVRAGLHATPASSVPGSTPAGDPRA
jgi:hypothetical protein